MVCAPWPAKGQEPLTLPFHGCGNLKESDFSSPQTILAEYRIHNADIVLKYDATADDLIDVIEGNRVYIPCIYLLNKIGKTLYYNFVTYGCLGKGCVLLSVDLIYQSISHYF